MGRYETPSAELFDALAEHIAVLERERDRLAQQLAGEPDWRALRQLDEREAAGDPVRAVDGGELRAALLQALSANRLFAAREKIVEAIGLLNGSRSCEPVQAPIRSMELSVLGARGQGQSSGGSALLAGPAGDPARGERGKVQRVADIASSLRAAMSTVAPTPAPRPVTDRLDLIAGLAPDAAARLTAGGVRRCEDIARWTAADVAIWRERLADCVGGPVGQLIEQAAMLAKGQPTRHAGQVLSDAVPALVPMPTPEPARLPECSAMPEHVTPIKVIHIEAEDPDLAGDEGCEAEVTEARPTSTARAEPSERDRERSAMLARAARTDEAEFEVSAKRPERSPPPLPPSPGKALRGSLLARLRGSREPERFDSDHYAAYRGEVQEASVTIIRPEKSTAADAVAARKPAAPDTGEAPVDRFLNALMGKP